MTDAGVERTPAGVATVRVDAPSPGRRSRTPGAHLRAVPRAPRRAPAQPILVGAGVVIVAMLALTGMHAFLISGQIRLDETRREVAQEAEEVRRLRRSVAELEAPERVLAVARDRLGMVLPDEVGYLLPASVDTGADGPVHVEAAEPPPPTTSAPVAPAGSSLSPEQQAVDAPPSAGSADADAGAGAGAGAGADADADPDAGADPASPVPASQVPASPDPASPDPGGAGEDGAAQGGAEEGGEIDAVNETGAVDEGAAG